MRDGPIDAEMATPQCLDAKSGHEWRQLSAQTQAHQRNHSTSEINVTLEAAAEREPQSPLAGVYRLWMAEMRARGGDLKAALPLYDRAVETLAANPSLGESIDGVGGALLQKAQTAALAGEAKAAVAAYQDLASRLPDDPDPWLQAGLVMEAAGDRAAAADLYRRVPAKVARRHRHQQDYARRCLSRLDTPDAAFALSAEHVADQLAVALKSGDAARLRRLASPTHFQIGGACCESAFEENIFLDRLCEELGKGGVGVRRRMSGAGDKRYLLTTGWRGRWFRGDVVFLITRSARGWQWTGLAIAAPNELWIEHWTPKVVQTNDPLPFELLAPFPDGLCCKAGGLSVYLVEQAVIVALAGGLPWPIGPAAAAAAAFALSLRDCGFGVPGLYYGAWPTHDEEDYFAVDFTRYQRAVPYINRSDGTPVLAARGGIVSRVSDGTPTGSTSANNVVEVQHGDPADPANTDRFMTRYLHMRGPKLIVPKLFDTIFTGNRIGLMNDTGRSVGSHLHFSIHDRQLIYPGYPPGKSVRPSPMNGITLGDGDTGKCVCSTNVETEGAKPMILPTGYAVQNWTITPVATAVGKAPPANIREQRFQLVLSGVALLDMKGVNSAQWRHETLLLYPDLRGPAKFVIDNFGLPKPVGFDEQSVNSLFQVEQWAPFASLGSIYNANESIHSGFAVDAWRPQPFGTATDLATNTPISNLFSGIQADIAVRDSDAYFYRIGYHITLIGRPIFTQVVIL